MSQAGQKPYCPSCGKPATGNFCQHCGAKLGGRFCNQCGAKLAPSAKFCNQCGAKAGSGGGGGGAETAAASVVSGSNLGWWIGGAAMFVLIVVVGMQMVEPAGPASPQGGAASPASGPSSVDLNSMTPIEAADRLYNRVMAAAERGDSTEAMSFLPMAINAYDLARPLNADGLFHLSLLQQTGGQLDEALTTARQILESDPDHLLGLSVAASVSAALGDDDEAEALYRRFLDVHDAQLARALPEYEIHAVSVQGAKAAAEAFLAGR